MSAVRSPTLVCCAINHCLDLHQALSLICMLVAPVLATDASVSELLFSYKLSHYKHEL